MIGTFEKLVFETSSTKIHTFDDFQRQGSATFAEHKVINGKPRLEFTGDDLDKISFTIRLDLHLGVDPATQIKIAWEMKSAGKPGTMIVGGVPLGDFVILSLSEKWKAVDGKGRLIIAYLDLSLKEYV